METLHNVNVSDSGGGYLRVELGGAAGAGASAPASAANDDLPATPAKPGGGSAVAT